MILTDNPAEPLHIRVGIRGSLNESFVHVLYFAHIVAAYFLNGATSLYQSTLDSALGIAQLGYGRPSRSSFNQSGGLRYRLLVVATLASKEFSSLFSLPEVYFALETYGNKRNTYLDVASGQFMSGVDDTISRLKNSVVWNLSIYAKKLPDILPVCGLVVYLGMGLTTKAENISAKKDMYCNFGQNAPWGVLTSGKEYFTQVSTRVTKVDGDLLKFKAGFAKAIHMKYRHKFQSYRLFGLPASQHGAISISQQGRSQTYSVMPRILSQKVPLLEPKWTQLFDGTMILQNVNFSEDVKQFAEAVGKGFTSDIPHVGRFERTLKAVWTADTADQNWNLNSWVGDTLNQMCSSTDSGSVNLNVYHLEEYLAVIQLMFNALFYRLEEINKLLVDTESAADVTEQIWQQEQIVAILNGSCSGRDIAAVFLQQASYLAGRYILPPLDPRATTKRWEGFGGNKWFLYFLHLLKLDTSGLLKGLIRTKAPLTLLCSVGGQVCTKCSYAVTAQGTSSSSNITTECPYCKHEPYSFVSCTSERYRSFLTAFYNDKLTPMQKKIADKIESMSAYNFAILGPAGSGKSLVAKYIIATYYVRYGVGSVLIAGPTNVVANNMMGRTFHSIFKLGCESFCRADVVAKCLDALPPFLYAGVQLLVLDEALLMEKGFLHFIDVFFKHLRGKGSSGNYFAGLRVLLLGDVLQLPSVTQSSYAVPSFFAEEEFYKGKFAVAYMNESLRFKNKMHAEKLLQLRSGDDSTAVLEYFNLECGSNSSPLIRKLLIEWSKEYIKEKADERNPEQLRKNQTQQKYLDKTVFEELAAHDADELLAKWFHVYVSTTAEKDHLKQLLLQVRVLCKEINEAMLYNRKITDFLKNKLNGT